jgi:hypothetical protein
LLLVPLLKANSYRVWRSGESLNHQSSRDFAAVMAQTTRKLDVFGILSTYSIK